MNKRKNRQLTWRERCAPTIAAILQQGEELQLNEKAIRKRLREAYPWNERLSHPYKIWCDEINRQLGKKKKKNTNPNQLNLF